MKRYLLVIVCLVALLAACGPGGDYVCRENVCIGLTVEGPVEYDKPTTFVIKVLAKDDVPSLAVNVDNYGAPEFQDIIEAPADAFLKWRDRGVLSWDLPAKAGHEYVFRGYVSFPRPKELAYGASFHVAARAVWGGGAFVDDHVHVYYDAEGNWVDPAQRRSYTGEDILVPTIHPSITVFIPTPTATFTPPTATPEPTPTVDPYPAPGEGLATPPEGVERAAPTVAAYPAP